MKTYEAIATSPTVEAVSKLSSLEYLDPRVALEDRVARAYTKLEMPEDEQRIIAEQLAEVRKRHEGTYEHSLRVGLLARRIAPYFHLHERTAMRAALLHDVGKLDVPVELLTKSGTWTPEDREAMEAHVLGSFNRVVTDFPYEAHIILHHHRFQKNSYPRDAELPGSLFEYSKDEQLRIEREGRVLALADQYDAFHRLNRANGVSEDSEITGEFIREQMLALNPDLRELIERLYQDGVFTVATVESGGTLADL